MMNHEHNIRILVVEDDSQIRKLLKVTLQAHKYTVYEASTGEEGIEQASLDAPDLMILDLGLPDQSGLVVLRRIREWSNLPVIVLTAIDREADKIIALDNGADDYVTKPFGMGELVARIRVALRHSAGSQEEPVLHHGELMINVAQRSVELKGEPIKLSPTEFDLLKILAFNAGRVITKSQLLKQVWNEHDDSNRHYLRIYIGHLRKKLEDNPAEPKYIVTEPGVGYRFLAAE
ncbi:MULTISPECIES: response regulator [unclassified Paenibacillus]|uniref:response regulator n=1 Tax=unclassified Paenibacillus TaxID=185978 RepID=UPI001C1237D5|nr:MULTISPECIES: response regulator [unclassified Paenibacillus]MBU5442466.1 response regulator [Paenibacillus sp. MSJ-34]CAH0120803.1 KDP operon transcriptional regulatory protein KdpE [Paenibacillus sp. CECT 9249]